MIGTNELIGTDPSKLPPALARLMAGQWKQGAIPPQMGWKDGRADRRVSRAGAGTNVIRVHQSWSTDETVLAEGPTLWVEVGQVKKLDVRGA